RWGTTKSPEEEVMLEAVSGHWPLEFRVSGSSANEPTQTRPKLPRSASTRLSRGAPALPETCTLCGPAGSSLKTVITADLAPTLVGSNRIATSTASPAPSTIGYETTLGTLNSGDDDVIFVIESVPSPLLSIVS